MEKRKIILMLTRFPGRFADFLEIVTGCYYTHASIGLEENKNIFYSFVGKGFIEEEITRYIRPGREPFPCQVYELEVSEEEYETIRHLINNFKKNKSVLKYSKLGVFFGLLRIPYKRKDHYFCSQFVAEILKEGRKKPLSKKSTRCFPEDLRDMFGMKLVFQGNHSTMATHFNLLSYKNREIMYPNNEFSKKIKIF